MIDHGRYAFLTLDPLADQAKAREHHVQGQPTIIPLNRS